MIISFVLSYPPYVFVYFLQSTHSKAEILSKQEPHFTPDYVKSHIKGYKERKHRGEVESMERLDKKV